MFCIWSAFIERDKQIHVCLSVCLNIRVNKVVSADSREAQTYLKSQSTKQEDDEDEEKSLSTSQSPLPGPRYKHTITHIDIQPLHQHLQIKIRMLPHLSYMDTFRELIQQLLRQ